MRAVGPLAAVLILAAQNVARAPYVHPLIAQFRAYLQAHSVTSINAIINDTTNTM